MALNKKNTVYACSECGTQSAKWYGKCPSCGAWNSMNEEDYSPPAPSKKAEGRRPRPLPAEPRLLLEVTAGEEIRRDTGVGEFNRVLGGGLVQGSAVLLSGEPGIGKSTLLLQICGSFTQGTRVLYVSGEESASQLKLRADRLGTRNDGLYVLNETNIENILEAADRVQPEVIIADSIQTLYSEGSGSSPGSVTQVRESAAALMNRAKSGSTSVIIVGHVNKEGGIAGPKVLEHMVDAVLYFEGEQRYSYRIVRAVKNRFGSTNEIGVFEMRGDGLTEVPNPSEMLLSGRIAGVAGNCAVCAVEGTRPVVAEIQALVTPTVFPAPRRTAAGIDINRLHLLLAVLEKRLRYRFSAQDVYINIVGGLRIEETACDIAAALALVSGLTDSPVAEDTAAFGEIGLAGELRRVPNPEQRVAEAARLGFKRIILPRGGREIRQKDIEILYARSVYEAVGIAMKG